MTVESHVAESTARARSRWTTPERAPLDEAEVRGRIERYNEILLTSCSILAGFAMTGLLGLPEAGSKAIAGIAVTLHLEPFPLAFTIVYYAMLLATLCFLGVLVSVVSGRLQGRASSLRSLRLSFRTSVVIFGVGLSGLFCATVTIGVPTFTGFLVGLIGGGAITLTMLFRALFRQ